MRRRRRTVYIGEQRWKLTRSRRTMPAFYGECDYASRTITVCSTLHGIDLLDTLIHEVIHARWPDLSEEAVLEVATLLAHVIDAEGFTDADD